MWHLRLYPVSGSERGNPQYKARRQSLRGEVLLISRHEHGFRENRTGNLNPIPSRPHTHVERWVSWIEKNKLQPTVIPKNGIFPKSLSHQARTCTATWHAFHTLPFVFRRKGKLKYLPRAEVSDTVSSLVCGWFVCDERTRCPGLWRGLRVDAMPLPMGSRS